MRCPGLPMVIICRNGLPLPSTPRFMRAPIMCRRHPACFWSRALKQVVDLSASLRVLDLCAAPGGKSTVLQSLLSPDSLLVSNEVIKTRVTILQQNMTRWGGGNGMITNNDPKDFSRLDGFFDLIVVDAPCSGSGLFRKDPAAIAEWSTDAVETCSLRQQRILNDVWPALKPGGVLLYATCSYSAAEDERIVDKIMTSMDAETIRLQTDPGWHIVETESPLAKGYGYRFYPDRLKGEGFFLACLRKTSGSPFRYPARNKDKPAKISPAGRSAAAAFIGEPDGRSLMDHNGLLYTLIESHIPAFYFLKDHLYFKKAGVLLGKMAGDALLPEHELALSGLVSPVTPRLALDLTQSLRYLRKEDIDPGETGRGWTLVEHLAKPLGWVKMLDRRMNNYYPKSWRILH